MNPSHVLVNPKLRIVLPLIVAVAVLAAFSAVSIAPAAAGSGGVSTGEEKQSKGSSPKYKRLWDKVSRRNKRWARSTAKCESGRDPKAIGGGGMYRGAFQFLKSTWRSSPKSPGGDPIKYPYRTQAVVAVALKKRDGRGHWPVCG